MTIAILLCTFNGARFLNLQLQSLEKQSFKDWRLYISDDGSSDETLEIIADFQNKWGDKRLTLMKGPQKGFVANFHSLIMNEEIQAEFYAFCDQDDLWLPQKLERALSFIHNKNCAALYGSKTISINNHNEVVGQSRDFIKPVTFENALMQSIMGANTMVFNHKTRELMQKVRVDLIVSHDWCLYQLVTGVGGHVTFDLNAFIYYRQHEGNLVGANHGLFSRLKRLWFLVNGGFAAWNRSNIALLEEVKGNFTPHNQAQFALFKAACKGSLKALREGKFYRQSRLETFIFATMIFLRRL